MIGDRATIWPHHVARSVIWGQECDVEARGMRQAPCAADCKGAAPALPTPASVSLTLAAVHRSGPDRSLFLPGGLLDRDDLPAYLDGELPGE